ncbi:hypothetical protein [Geotalea toluenoxydans]|uniref:hypothetical protein n=1 Tax=Geotalea toluenoxydans TaxID=421624 RepID=UPI001FB35E82|nr:hypothetical protein [Geotalea toluenoxydans]
MDAIALAEESIKAGETLSLQARGALGKIVQGVERTAVQLAEIARATREQALGSDQIRNAMEHVTAMANSIAGTTFEQRKVSELIHGEVRAGEGVFFGGYAVHERTGKGRRYDQPYGKAGVGVQQRHQGGVYRADQRQFAHQKDGA